MKKIIFGLAILLTGFSSCHVYTPVQQTDSYTDNTQEVSYQRFYDDLSPYGQWVDYPEYGYVWAPSEGPGFKPYASNGHWVYSDIGWTWVSGYDWGWAPFHYGRWFYDNSYGGWMWIPGNEWAPAWVTWRSSNDYYGWAPLGPNTGYGYANNSYNEPVNSWSFVPQRYVTNQNINNYYVSERNNVTIINNTTVINNVTYNNNAPRTNTNPVNNNTRRVFSGGPDPREVERATNTPVRPVVTRETNRPEMAQVNNNQLGIFRPRINTPANNNNNGNNNNNNSQPRPAPARFQPFRGNTQTGNNNPVNGGNTQQPPSRIPSNGNVSTPVQTPVNHNNEGNPFERPGNRNTAPVNSNPAANTAPVQNSNPNGSGNAVPVTPLPGRTNTPVTMPAPVNHNNNNPSSRQDNGNAQPVNNIPQNRNVVPQNNNSNTPPMPGNSRPGFKPNNQQQPVNTAQPAVRAPLGRPATTPQNQPAVRNNNQPVKPPVQRPVEKKKEEPKPKDEDRKN